MKSEWLWMFFEWEVAVQKYCKQLKHLLISRCNETVNEKVEEILYISIIFWLAMIIIKTVIRSEYMLYLNLWLHWNLSPT